MHFFSILNHYFQVHPQYWRPKFLLRPIQTHRGGFAVLRYYARIHDLEFEDEFLHRYD